MIAALGERIGIVQGRLVVSATGELQCSPGQRWREEFTIASELGLHHIELIVDRFVDQANPIWTAAGRRELNAVVRASGVGVPSLCVDETLDQPIDDLDFLGDLTARLDPVVSELGVRTVVVPLFEASDLASVDRRLAVQALTQFSENLAAQGARLVLELAVPAPEGIAFIDEITGPGVGISYDTGNAVAFGFDVLAELALLGDRVWHMHAKDKNSRGHNVRYGNGEVPFAEVLTLLSERGYSGLFTMETTRGENPVVTAKQHRDFLVDASL